MITHGRETYQPTSIMRWDRGIFNGSDVPDIWPNICVSFLLSQKYSFCFMFVSFLFSSIRHCFHIWANSSVVLNRCRFKNLSKFEILKNQVEPPSSLFHVDYMDPLSGSVKSLFLLLQSSFFFGLNPIFCWFLNHFFGANVHFTRHCLNQSSCYFDIPSGSLW